MTKTKGYKVLVAALAFVLVLMLLSACSEDNNSGSNTNQGAEKNNASSVGNTAEELTLFIDAPWYPVKEWKGPITEKITEKTGIKLKVTVATDDKQLPLMIASGDLPDLVFTYGNVSRLSDSKLSYPWNELIEKYAPDFKIDKTRIAIHTMDDGNFYTIRNAFATQEEWAANKYALGNNGNPGIAVREDILKQLGNPPIKTLDDFVNVLGMVKDKYPDMVPLIMDKEWIEQYFLMQFGVDATFGSPWFEQGGKVDFFIRHQKMKDYFKFMNKLYRSGYIMAENFAHANDKIDDQYATSGRAFAHMYTVSVADSDNAVVKREGGAFTFKMLPTSLSSDAKIISGGVGFAGTFITKKNKNPEKSIKLLQYLATDEGKKLTMFGIEGEHWTWNEEGYPNLKYDPNNGQFVESNGIKWWYLYNDGITEGLWSYVPGTMTTQSLMEIKKITKYKPELGLIQAGPDSKERTMRTKIDEMIKNEKVKVYLAKSEEEAMANYENMVKNAEQLGLQKLVEWANETYQKRKDLFK
ncbi:extracellular solute-binding protein [Paenibacillus sp. FSL H7-0331]|uniref:extracellular solute-binding protein n=1 Tax=Paenibacillus sp. FSL H7-0331 TaxID=1920421 RepID=UPI00096CE3C9|nr:extracellular solute-binding protein [Paenibacillus sp. FSL H7-0331]OMF11371.1 ABC transporter substrate-binding protein [Paenibacillus sp. FSL H7-0331]